MYKVLIVDDEEVICQGLRRLIDWNSCGFTVAATALSGAEGVAAVKRCQPDLVITDIKMPEMSGLEMMRQLLQMGFDGIFLITTGYADFSYAQKAIHQGVRAYLVKPIDERELAGELYAIKKELDKRREKQSFMEQTVRLSFEKYLEQFCSGLLSSEETDRLLLEFPPAQGKSSYQAVLIRLSARHADEEAVRACLDMLKHSMERTGYYFLFLSNKTLVFLSTSPRPLNPVPFEQLSKRVREQFGFSILTAAGEKEQSFLKLPLSYQNAVLLYEKEFLYGYRGVILPDCLCTQKPAEKLTATEQSSQLLLAIECDSLVEINNTLEIWMESFISTAASEVEVKTAYTNLFLLLAGQLRENYPEADPALFDSQGLVEKVYLAANIAELNAVIKKQLAFLAEELYTTQPDHVAKKIQQFIERNYQENLTLESIAQIFHYNPTYLGRKFKNTTGDSFNEYLNRYRIEKAKDFLRSGYRVQHAARLAGYRNVDYFNTKFKQYTGMSPSAYKAAPKSKS